MLRHILKNGEEREDRTGTGTIGVFGYQNRYDLEEGFPLVTTKEVDFSVVLAESKWFLSGSTNVRTLQGMGANIWNADSYRWYLERSRRGEVLRKYRGLSKDAYLYLIKNNRDFAELYGDLGPIYGEQWRSWEVHNGQSEPKFIDQIANVIESLRTDPYGRRHIVSAWNPAELDEMALPPCHLMFQFYVSNDRKLSCQLYQRSADAFLGVPFNIASYASMIHFIASETGLGLGEFIHTFGDLHIYKDHIEQVKYQLTREPRPLPTLTVSNEVEYSKGAFSIDRDVWLQGYDPHPKISGKVSVGK